MIAAETKVERQVEYTFAINRKNLKCKETLFVSDQHADRDPSEAGDGSGSDGEVTKRESHYRYTHPKNAGEFPVHEAHSIDD
jgi:hypothetical protein